MREGSLEAPVRHALDWQNPDFYDFDKIEAEMHRVFDICHTCRRCFNLCDAFPRLFDLIDESPSGELDGVKPADYKQVVDRCTLCDLCFMTKCPYVPPHEWALDFPHLLLRYRAAEVQHGKASKVYKQLTETDRNGKLGSFAAPVINYVNELKPARATMEAVAHIDAEAKLPTFNGRTLVMRAAAEPLKVNEAAPAYGRKAVLYATCFSNYNNPEIGMATRKVLAHLGVATEVVYPRCCGMPQFERGDVARVSEHAQTVSEALLPYIEHGYDVIALVPSCALMLKFEWPLVRPDDPKVKTLSEATYDVAEYVVGIAEREGLVPGLKPIEGGVALHIACHARAQNVGHKAAEMLRLIPDPDVQVIERCSGHGGAWGVMKGNFDIAIKVGRPVARQALQSAKAHVASECPLAADHIVQGMAKLANGAAFPQQSEHPIQLFARSYGLI